MKCIAEWPSCYYEHPGFFDPSINMNQIKLSGWLQVAANIGIVAGLLLVGVQLKQNSDLLKTQMLYEESSRAMDIETMVIGERGAEVWAKSISDPQNLNLEEQRVIEALLWSYTEQLRAAYMLHELGLLDSEEWKKRVTSDSNFYLSNEYGRAWWANYSGADSYSQELKDVINAHLAQADKDFTPNYLKSVLEKVRASSPAIVLDTDPTIAIIGTGDMGDSLGPRLAKLGYRIVYGSRSPDSEKVQALVQMTGNEASAASPIDAAQQGDIVLTLVPWPAMIEVAQSLGDLDGKIVIDVSMPFEQGEDGYPQKIVDTSSAEIIQGYNPGARVVKAWATLGSQVIDDTAAVDGPISVPLASDDREAKEYVAKIVAAMGMDPVDFGPLRMAREIETLQMIYMVPLVQGRDQSWEFYFRRSNYWYCQESEGWYDPVFDAGELATFPLTQGESEPCPVTE
jgi:predicted dinucleotide-binding enzyme